MNLLKKNNLIFFLGVGGLIPFWGLSIVPIFDDTLVYLVTELQVFYGAVILSFLGGVHWGVQLVKGEKTNWKQLAWGVSPSLIGWLALSLPIKWGIIALVIGLVISLIVDLRFFNAPSYHCYKQIRLLLTIMAVAAIIINLILS